MENRRNLKLERSEEREFVSVAYRKVREEEEESEAEG